MPQKPLRPCNKPGCPNLTQSRYCEQHAKQEARRYEQERGTAHERGYGSRWRRYREHYLRQHPLCAECLKVDKVVPATEVDHKISHKGDHKLFWDPNNHQSLCKSCHSRKTVREDGGFGVAKK
ncbi:MAG: HNH endonuclease [Clostridia bacterium]|nr:HNH endonuclease [Clostridia bacterium]